MADYKLLVPFIKKWEGGYSDGSNGDAGGCTMCGVTIAVYQKYYGEDKTCEDLKHIKDSEWNHIFKTGYWDKMKADSIENQSIANLCVNECWGSGPKTAIKHIQRALGLEDDGIVGKKTLAALNDTDTKRTFDILWQDRAKWLRQIAMKGNNAKFLKGWIRRLSDIKYQA